MASALRTTLFALGFTTIGAAAGITASALAGPPSARASSGPMKFAMAMAGLDLSAEQQQMLTDLRDGVQADAKAMKRSDRAENKVIADAIMEGAEIDREAAHQRIDEAIAAKSAMAHKVMDGLFDVYESLDEAQRTELSEMIQSRMDQHERRRSQMDSDQGPSGQR
jgi:Spy/CpxP family protein refolding chaperone